MVLNTLAVFIEPPPNSSVVYKKVANTLFDVVSNPIRLVINPDAIHGKACGVGEDLVEAILSCGKRSFVDIYDSIEDLIFKGVKLIYSVSIVDVSHAPSDEFCRIVVPALTEEVALMPRVAFYISG